MLPERDPMDSSVAQDERYRVELTTSCRDCDDVPKVDGAGEVVEADGRTVQLMHNGVRVVAGGYYGDWMQEIIRRLRGHHEPQEERVFHEIVARLPETATMVELGAFWAYYSVWFAYGAPGRRAVAVEPDPDNLEVGRANADLNDVRVEFLQACAGGESVEAIDFPSENAGTIRIPQVTVPDLVERYGFDVLDVLHCDTQGAELGVLEASRGLAEAGRLRWVVVSTHSHHISGDPLIHQRCLALLRELGGTVLVEHDVHESFSGDGLIVAWLGPYDVDLGDLTLSYNRSSTSLFRHPLFDLDESRRALAASEAALHHAERHIARLESQPDAPAPATPEPTAQEPIAREAVRLAKRVGVAVRRRLRR